MTRHIRTKLQTLLLSWPTGGVHTSAGLEKRGYNRRLLHQYRKSGWLSSLGSGAYGRAGDKITWPAAVSAMQGELDLSVHPGSSTALNLQGVSHFVALGDLPVQLYGQRNEKLPAWFTNSDWKAKVNYHPTQLFKENDTLGLVKHEGFASPVQISSRERAILELLHLVPQKESFEHARLLMEGLINLRPALVQKLLLACQSIKVRRLFMILAEACNMPWLNRIDKQSIDFGRAKRALCANGRMHPKYLLSVPENYFRES